MYFLKNINYISGKKALGLLFLIFAGLLIVGCSANGTSEGNGAEAKETVDKSEQAIRTVIEKEFNGPDEKYKELWDAAMEAQNNVENQEEFDALQETPVWKNYMNYMAETYASYFTENGYDNFLNTTPAFMYSGFEGDYDLTASNIEISQNENNLKMYQFTFQVDYKNAKGEVHPYSFEGEAIASEEGKIEKLQFLDKDDLLTSMNEDIY